MSPPRSGIGKLKRTVAVFTVGFFGIGIVFHVTFKGFDFFDALVATIGLAVEHPQAVFLIVGIGIVFALMTAVGDRVG